MSLELRQRMATAAGQRGLAVPPTDLDLLCGMNVTSRAVAEQVIWSDASAVLNNFDQLWQAAQGSAPDGSQLYGALQSWRAEHDAPEVRDTTDVDLGRLAAAAPSTVEELRGALTVLVPHLLPFGPQIAQTLGLGPHAGPGPAEAAGEAQPQPVVDPEQATSASQPASPGPVAAPEPQLPDPSRPFDWAQHPRFVSFDWSEAGRQPVGHADADYVDGRVQFEWTPAPEPAAVTFYRIISSDATWPTGSPDMEATVGVTSATAGTATVDSRGASITYFAIWAHQGDSPLAAARTQPILIAQSEVVWPPSAFTTNVTPDKAVTGSWTAPAGSRVEVQRFPAGVNISYDPSRQLPADAVFTGGFIDRAAPQGQQVVYAAFCLAELPNGATAVSDPETVEARVTPEAQQIEFKVERSTARPGAYTITWIPPKYGKVELYATNVPLPAGLDKEARSWEVLQREGLTSEYLISYPADDLGGLWSIPEFVVDPSWVRVHFVAVHRVDEETAWMSAPISMVSPSAPTWARVIERVDSQIITFPWPEDVKFVKAYQGPKGVEIDPYSNRAIEQMTRDEYDRRGGMRVTRALPSNGCALHLFGVVYLDGSEVYSPGITIDYPGIARLRYEIVGMAGNQVAQGNLPPNRYRVFCTSDAELRELPLAFVAHGARLPLEPTDGELVRNETVTLAADTRTHVFDLPVGQRPMYGRLFISVRPEEADAVAVLDPHISTLGLWL